MSVVLAYKKKHKDFLTVEKFLHTPHQNKDLSFCTVPKIFESSTSTSENKTNDLEKLFVVSVL